MEEADGGESYNVAIGYHAMGDVDHDDSDSNVAIGGSALAGGDAAVKNCVAIGYNALDHTAGNAQDGTVAIGKGALTALTSGGSNTAVGYLALTAVTANGYNTAVGATALDACTGAQNTAVGWDAGGSIIGGDNNVCIGSNSGDVITTGDGNTILGDGADPSANDGANQTVIGFNTTGVADNSVTLGNASVTAVHCGQDAATAGAGARIFAKKIITRSDDASDYCGTFENRGDNANRLGISVRAGAYGPSSAGDCKYVSFFDGDETAAGGIQNSSTVANPEFFNGSDLRMKKDIATTQMKGLDTINAIPLKEWEWNHTKDIPKTKIGIVADDLEKVLPDSIGEMHDMKGWEHCVKEGEKPLKTIPTETQLTLLLMKAVQELTAKVEALEAK